MRYYVQGVRAVLARELLRAGPCTIKVSHKCWMLNTCLVHSCDHSTIPGTSVVQSMLPLHTPRSWVCRPVSSCRIQLWSTYHNTIYGCARAHASCTQGSRMDNTDHDSIPAQVHRPAAFATPSTGCHPCILTTILTTSLCRRCIPQRLGRPQCEATAHCMATVTCARPLQLLTSPLWSTSF